MKSSLTIILEAVILASALSMDAFLASFAYGSNKIKIPVLSSQIINIICSLVLALSILIGKLSKPYIPEKMTLLLSFSILFVLGLSKLLDSIIKSKIRKYNKFNKEIKFSMFNIKFILNLYANPEEADIDLSRSLSPKEAISLAMALSLDGLALGFAAVLGNANGLAIILASLITDGIAIILGSYIGNKIASKSNCNLSWLGGLLLIVLGILKLI